MSQIKITETEVQIELDDGSTAFYAVPINVNIDVLVSALQTMKAERLRQAREM